MGISIAHMTTLAAAEEAGQKLAQGLGAASLADLRAKPADELLKNGRGPFAIIVDGWYVPEDLSLTYAHHKENDVDILVGSNRDEGTFFSRPGGGNAEQFSGAAKKRFTGDGGCLFEAVSGQLGYGSGHVAAGEFPRRNGLAHADLGAIAVGARKRQSVPLFLHARTAIGAWSAFARRHAHRGSGLYVRQSCAKCDVDRHR